MLLYKKNVLCDILLLLYGNIVRCRREAMKQNPRRYISHIVLLCILAVLFCACAKQTEYGEPFTEVTGQPTVTEPGISAALEDNKPTDVTVDAPEKADEKEESAPTPTGVPTGTPAPIITDPYDGRFWTGKYAEDTALLLTKAQIAEQNEKNFSATGTKLVTLSKRTVYTAGEILEMIEAYSLPSRKYFDNREFGASEKERLQQERNLSVLRENPAGEIIPEYGILISNTDMRSFPTELRLTSQVQGRFDYLQETRLLIGEPVLVLHRSRDGAWCFVQAENYYGWIKESSVAYCSKDELCAVTDAIASMESNRIAVVTKNANYRIGERDIYLRMGTRLLCSDAGMQEEESGQTEVGKEAALCPSENIRVEDRVTIRVPCRDASGNLVWEEASVSSMDADGERCFVRGYLPYTRANIMQLAVRLLGTPYAWGDAPSFGMDVREAGDNGMDCSSTVSAVFRCFGFVLPRNTGTQRKMDCAKQELSELGTKQRQEALDSLRGGELLYTSGHVMLYLGKTDGEYYVLHNTSTESRDDGGKDEFYRCVITTLQLGKAGQTILERLLQRNALFPID